MKKMFVSIMVLGLLVANSALGQPVLAPHNNAPSGGMKIVPIPKAINPNTKSDQIDPTVKVVIRPTVAPAIEAGPAVWTPHVNSVQAVLRGTQSQAPTIVPDRFHQITLGSWRDICVDKNLQSNGMWLGELVPGSPQRGNGVDFATSVTSLNTPFALADVHWTQWSWDSPNSLGFSPTFTSYFPEVLGVAGTTTITSGPTSQQVNYLGYVGARMAYLTGNQAGLDSVRNYVQPMASYGLSCQVEVNRGSDVVARARVDLAFTGDTSTEVMITTTGPGTATLMVLGRPYQYYNLLSSPTTGEGANWQPFTSLPVLSGTEVTITANEAQMYFRAYQGQ